MASATRADDSAGSLGGVPPTVTTALPVQVSAKASGAYEASIVAHDDGLAVAWYDTRDGYPQIFVRFLDGERPAPEELQLTRGKRFSYEPSMQVAGERIIVGWYDRPASGDRWAARVGAWSREGSQIWQARLSGLHTTGRNPVIRIVDSKVFCAWLEGRPGRPPSVWVAWFDLNGRPVIPARRVAPASRNTWNLNAAVDGDGRAWVVFDARIGTRRSELFLVRVDATTTDVDRISRDDGFHSVYPDIALDGPNAALTWFDERDGNTEVYLFAADREAFTSALTSQVAETHARRVTETSGQSIGAYVTWNGSTGGLAWCDDTPGQYEVFFQPFDTRGAPLSPARRLSHSAPGSLIPAITAWRDGFALAWNEYLPAARRDSRRASQSAVVMTTIP